MLKDGLNVSNHDGNAQNLDLGSPSLRLRPSTEHFWQIATIDISSDLLGLPLAASLRDGRYEFYIC